MKVEILHRRSVQDTTKTTGEDDSISPEVDGSKDSHEIGEAEQDRVAESQEQAATRIQVQLFRQAHVTVSVAFSVSRCSSLVYPPCI